MYVAAIDVGGTKIVGAAVDRKGEIKTPIRVENTGLSGEFIVETCVDIFHRLSRQHEIKALAVGTGGRYRQESGRSVYRLCGTEHQRDLRNELPSSRGD